MTYLPNDKTATTGRYQVLLYDNNFGAAESYPKSTGASWAPRW